MFHFYNLIWISFLLEHKHIKWKKWHWLNNGLHEEEVGSLNCCHRLLELVKRFPSWRVILVITMHYNASSVSEGFILLVTIPGLWKAHELIIVNLGCQTVVDKCNLLSQQLPNNLQFDFTTLSSFMIELLQCLVTFEWWFSAERIVIIVCFCNFIVVQYL